MRGLRRLSAIAIGLAVASTMVVGGVSYAVGTGGGARPRRDVVLSSTTTSVATTSPAATSTTTVTVPSRTGRTWHFEGSQRGVERWFVSARCHLLTHHQTQTWTQADGTIWHLVEDYCDAIDAHLLWSGAGTFVISTEDGSALSGRMAWSVQLPTVGVPYALNVTTATGRFAGARGVCALEDHLRIPEGGLTLHHGAFSCDLRI